MVNDLEKENKKEEKKEKDFLLPASIILAAIIIFIGFVYNTGKNVKTSNRAQDNLPQEIPVESDPYQIPDVNQNDKISGSINAPIKIIEYSDLECPFCKKFHFTLETVKTIYGDQVAIVFRHFPLTVLHSKAEIEAQALECAYKLGGNNAFWSYLNKIFSITPSNDGLDLNELPNIAKQVGLSTIDFEACMKSDYGKDLIKKQYEEATKARARGTPYAVVINNAGKRYAVEGAYPLEMLKPIIDKAIQENK
jgi:protein-disulfide isomerase